MKKFKISNYDDVVDFSTVEPLTPMTAIHAKCKECCCWDESEVKMCQIKKCPLWQFKERGFKNSYTSNHTEEQREKARKNMLEYHRKKKEGGA